MPASNQTQKPQPTAIRIFSRLCLVLGALILLLFLPAGRWDWLQAWALVICFGVFLLLYVVWSVHGDPEQLEERSRTAQNVKSWDKLILGIYTGLLPFVFVLAGLDAGRFRWSMVPAGAMGLSWVGLALAAGLIFWTVRTNTYLSRHARIQADRGQVVISSGPYRYVRHPMYLGIILFFVSLPPALGSFFAWAPGLAIAILFVIRTYKEDVMLRDELPGYAEYARRVRYRLVPGIW